MKSSIVCGGALRKLAFTTATSCPGTLELGSVRAGTKRYGASRSYRDLRRCHDSPFRAQWLGWRGWQRVTLVDVSHCYRDRAVTGLAHNLR